jgi:hypothetical protein
MTDVTQAASQEPAADLDSIIDSAIETHTKDDTPAAEPAVEASPEPKVDETGRLHGKDGKFIPKAKDEIPAVEAASQEPTVEAATPAPEPAPEPVIQPLEAPARWTADEKAKFASWPRDVQEAVLERNRALEADYTRKTQETAELRRSAEPILNAIKPFESYLNQVSARIGQTPDRMLANLVGVEYQLRTGEPWQKAQALNQIAAEYGIDLAAMSRGEMPAAPDPHNQQLRQQFGSLEQRLSQFEQMMQAEQQRQTASQIESFKSATDQTGRPLRPHFERVRGVMGQLMSEDGSLSLEQAYQKAVEPINAAIADELKQRETLAEQQRQAALEKAKKATPVKVSGSLPNGSTKSKDLDSILSNALDAHFQ